MNLINVGFSRSSAGNIFIVFLAHIKLVSFTSTLVGKTVPTDNNSCQRKLIVAQG